ncbi:MAG: hypothetical protein LBR43_03360 [Spiroplasmataceae bacterium]|nr:hypothetical protein [Spiroplasmataceae bacterium]
MNFTCNYCQKTYHEDNLGSVNEYHKEHLFKEKNKLEQEKARLETEALVAIEEKDKETLSNQIKKLNQDLHYLYLKEKIGKEYICKQCFDKFKIKETKSFKCEVCQLEIKGKLFEGHVDNYRWQGINPLSWTKFCQSCKDNRIINASLYCPRTGNGRDSWDLSEPRFDCSCPVIE